MENATIVKAWCYPVERPGMFNQMKVLRAVACLYADDGATLLREKCQPERFVLADQAELNEKVVERLLSVRNTVYEQYFEPVTVEGSEGESLENLIEKWGTIAQVDEFYRARHQAMQSQMHLADEMIQSFNPFQAINPLTAVARQKNYELRMRVKQPEPESDPKKKNGPTGRGMGRR